MSERAMAVDEHPTPAGGPVNPWALKRPQARTETKTFTDPLQPGVELRLTFRELLDAGLRLQASQTGDELCADYLALDGQPPKRLFASPDGQPVELNAALLNNIGAFMVMQVPEAGQLPMTLADWLGWAVMCPNLFIAVVRWMGTLLGSGGEGVKQPPTPTNAPS
jgi:hypothetical protein